MPVKSGHFDRRVVLAGKMIFGGPHQHPNDGGHAGEDVDGVETGHGEIHREEDMGVIPLNPVEGIEFTGKLSEMNFVGVFEIFNNQKYEGQQ